MTRARDISGFGLIEVLVSLLVVVIGTMGMAGLHSRSLQYNQMAYLHSRGIILATDMLDRIRVNKGQALTTNNYQVEADDAIPASCSSESYPDSCETGSCSPDQLAQYDISQWKFQILCQLPDASGAITYEDSSGSRIYTITLSFNSDVGHLKPADLVLRSAI